MVAECDRNGKQVRADGLAETTGREGPKASWLGKLFAGPAGRSLLGSQHVAALL